MSQDNLIAKEIQSLEISDAVVDLYELAYSPTTTLYFHSGVSPDTRVIKVDGNTITLNVAQTLSDNSTLVFTGLNNATSVTASINALVNGTTSNSQTVVIDTKTGDTTAATGWKGDIEVGMVVTGTDIKNDEYGEVVFNKNIYYGFPIHLDGVDISNEGAHSRPTLTLANVESILRTSSTFQNAFDIQRAEATGATGSGLTNFKLDDLIGKKVTRRRTLEKYLKVSDGQSTDDAWATDIIELPKSMFVIDRIAAKTALFVTLELASPFDLSGLRVPRREVVGKYCSWIYKGKNDYTTSALTGTVSASGTTVTGHSTDWVPASGVTPELVVGDEIIIDGRYIREIATITNDTTLTVRNALPTITTDGSRNNTDNEPGPLSFAKITRRNRGACRWDIGGLLDTYNATSSAIDDYRVYYSQNDEPIIYWGVTHTWDSSNNEWDKRTSESNTVVQPQEWASNTTSLALKNGDIVWQTEDGDEVYYLFIGGPRTGADTTVTTKPSRAASASWQPIRHYDIWTDRAYTINSNDALKNEYVLYPVPDWGKTQGGTIGYVDTSTVWRNSVSLAASSGKKPSLDSAFWAPGDSCGKLLMSCKKRYQFQPSHIDAKEGYTVPSVDRDTNAVLPFGGFPGSRKFR